MMMASKSYEKHLAHKELYDALIQSLFLDEEDIDKAAADMGEYALSKRKHDDQDKYPFAGSNQGKRKRRSGKDSEPSKKSSASKKTSKGDTLPKSSKTGKSASAEESVKEATHEATMGEEEPVQEKVNNADQPQDGEAAPKNDLFKKSPRPPTLDPDKPLPLKGHPSHLTVASEYFFNNDLEYLKSSDSERKYTTSITKMKAVRYELVGIEYMIPKHCSTTKVGYDKDVERGIKHWRPNHQLFYISQLNRFSKHDVYSHLKIMSMKSMTVNKMHGYSYLEEIMVRRADGQLNKFKEGEFVNLHLNDIKDMLLLVVQHKLFHLDGKVIVDLAMALCRIDVL
ncbi:hypothetical protein Tco_0531192 [Tanacetum coccineum]